MGTDYKYLVGIRCFTYNQSAYIPDALNGFVSQQTTFPFVIMVVDDASTDGKQDVIKSFITDNFDSSTTKYESRDYADITFAQHKTNKNCNIVAMFLQQNIYRKGENAQKLDYLSEWRNC
ncbi:MAG: glycosyltransferase family 2 protein, partial [Bacteroidaceae bacterium]|nr:glycosyltransferase family 2 protein [Bacteroidaceae bacterium]